jgi:hypothetical protein
LLERGVEAAWRRDPVDQARGERSRASILCAVIISQRARPQPINRGNSAAWITEGIPTLTSGIPNLAVRCDVSAREIKRAFCRASWY